jgi:hypothetical protein
MGCISDIPNLSSFLVCVGRALQSGIARFSKYILILLFTRLLVSGPIALSQIYSTTNVVKHCQRIVGLWGMMYVSRGGDVDETRMLTRVLWGRGIDWGISHGEKRGEF